MILSLLNYRIDIRRTSVFRARYSLYVVEQHGLVVTLMEFFRPESMRLVQ
jgi:hypothetical protein